MCYYVKVMQCNLFVFWMAIKGFNKIHRIKCLVLLQLCFYTVHLGACGFYYIAKQNGFSATSWVGANSDWIGGGSAVDK